MELKNYQLTAIEDLLGKCWKLLGIEEASIVFRSPTGSGKTIMMAELLKRLAEKAKQSSEKERIFSFVWIAPQNLHQQSKDKLERYYADTQILECKNYRDLNDRQIGENEILFLNWESTNKTEKNIIIKENERGDNLSKIIDNTVQNKREIILIVDESHNSANTPIAKDLINVLRPSIRIYVSATPSPSRPHDMTVIQIKEVKEEEMIKDSIMINVGFGSSIFDDDGKIRNDLPVKNLKEIVLEEALKKREEIAKTFLLEGHNINPLLLVQLPDRMKGVEIEPVKNDIIDILANNGITEANCKLAVRLSEAKKNLEGIEKNDNEIQVMLFKQAIVLGWDCPRAYVLALFREWHSQIFSIQTLGRIMRMPLPDVGYFKNKILNLAYVYTSHQEIEIDKDIDKNYISPYTSNRRKDYENITLFSIYRKQQRDKTRLDPSFIGIFQQEAEKYNLKNKIETKKQEVSRKFISNQHSENIDKIDSIKGNVDIKQHSPKDLQDYFDDLVRKNIQPLPPENRSIARVKDAIYKFLQKEFNLHYINPSHLTAEAFDDIRFTEDFTEIISIVMSDHNSDFFITAIKNAVEAYLDIKVKKEEEFIRKDDWEVPEVIGYGSNYAKEQKQKSVMQPFYRRNDSTGIEREFIADLEKSSKVKWWFKNGDHGSMYFAVPYEESGKKHLFYVDFVVLLENGKIMLYDTKDGFTLESAQEKAKGLVDYICEQKNIGGGIVTKHNNTWRISPKDASNIGKEHLQEWDFLEEI